MNTAQQEAPGVGSLREWVEAILKGGRPSVIHTPGNDSEALKIMDAALTLPKFFGERNYTCNVSATKSVTANGFGVAVAKRGESTRAEFKVMPVNKGTRPQAVTQTSREAYRSINLDTLQKEVVKAALESGETYDRHLAGKIGKGPNDVSARRNELEQGDFEYNGKMYRIEYHIQKPSLHTGRRVQWWRVVEAVGGQGKLF